MRRFALMLAAAAGATALLSAPALAAPAQARAAGYHDPHDAVPWDVVAWGLAQYWDHWKWGHFDHDLDKGFDHDWEHTRNGDAYEDLEDLLHGG
ncbi:hypothetical protein MF672_003635 [Actinomadura sp. ATCC 31491]|uniref:Uncharacterized protein n=1 Tax=Actinomadura luzonensis TaxID=2805427 RepID=A0ABT0FLG4_9ACTN|nr:hypothetical protein [Actinomadura luzonensis]MCK2212895.1 hypothetical protein [Actinomadura luzonensis]